jgi:curli biogenesis system outer membrane secretion channel CsgG
LWAVVAAGATGMGGCSLSVSNPWTFDQPPAVDAGDEMVRPPRPGRTVIAVAAFANPTSSPLNWRDIGSAMSDALRRTLLSETDYEVRIETQAQKSSSSSFFSSKKKDKSKTGPSEVDFVLAGRVTDFNHTSTLPRDVSRWGVFRRRSEAVVAIEWSIVDARTRQVVASDHVYGTADAGRGPIDKQYAGIDFRSYLFWSTPLGRASRQAIGRSVDRIGDVLPVHSGEPSIVKVVGNRKLKVAAGWGHHVVAGEEYYLYAPDPAGKAPTLVYDVDTGRPLMVRIDRVRKDESTAWLLGKAPLGVELRGAVLSRDPPGAATGAGALAAGGNPGP